MSQIDSKFAHEWVTKSGRLVTAKIPLYVFMHDLACITDSTGTCVRRDTGIAKTAPAEELAKNLEAISFVEVECKTCKSRMLEHDKSTYRISNECESCAQARFQVEFEKLDKKLAAKEAKRDAAQYQKGFRFKTSIWVHAGGDDVQYIQYSKDKPTDDGIKAFLNKKKSRVMDDFSTVEIVP